MPESPPPATTESDKGSPGIPMWIAVASWVIATGAITVLIAVLFQRTTGPGEVLHDYYRAVSAQDCTGAYDLLGDQARAETSRETFCEFISDEGRLPADFAIQTSVLNGPSEDLANVTVVEQGSGASPGTVTWALARSEDGWALTSPTPVSTGS